MDDAAYHRHISDATYSRPRTLEGRKRSARMERPWIWWSLLETGERPGVEPSEALDNARTEHRLCHSGGGDVDVSGAPENGTDGARGNARDPSAESCVAYEQTHAAEPLTASVWAAPDLRPSDE